MNADKLIKAAYYLSGVVSRDLDTVAGSQVADGLMWLNFILSENSSDGGLVPYYSHTNFDTVAGQEEYFVPGLVDLATLTFTLGDVRYSTAHRLRNRYFGSNRVNNLTSLPFTFTDERTIGGTNIFFYYIPDGVYNIQIDGLFQLPALALMDDLSTIFDQYYIQYLVYKLAQRICQFNSIVFAQDKLQVLENLERKIPKVHNTDMRCNVSTPFSGYPYMNYGQINIGRSFYP